MKSKRLEELIPDSEMRNRMVEQLYSGRPLLGEDSVFSEMLQAVVNAIFSWLRSSSLQLSLASLRCPAGRFLFIESSRCYVFCARLRLSRSR